MDRNLILPHCIARLAKMRPDALFLQTVAGGQMTYAETHRSALCWADALATLGIEAEQQVAIMMPNRPEAVTAWIGAAWLRARQVPVNSAYKGRILEHVLVNSESRVLIIAASLTDQLLLVDMSETQISHVVVLDASESELPVLSVPVITQHQFLRNANARDRQGPEHYDVASITYTSGTTGLSKGVVVYWAQLYETCMANAEIGFGADDCWYNPMPMFHIGGQGPVYQAALAGGRVVLRESFSTTDYLYDIRRFRCTVGTMIETMANFLMRFPPSPEDRDNPLRYVHMVPVLADVDEFKHRFGVEAGTAHGMTEIATCIAMSNCNNVNHLSCGRLRPGFEARIVDDNDEELPDGTAGELIVRANRPWTLCGGYFNMAEATVRAWRNGWFHTGDVLKRDEDGQYYFVDRLKDAIRRRGENVSSKEVESEINIHTAVAASAVVGVPSEHGEDEVKAFIVTVENATLAPEDLIRFLEPRLPHFMIPRFIEFVDALPQTPSSKVQKNLLRDRDHGPNCWDREAESMKLRRMKEKH